MFVILRRLLRWLFGAAKPTVGGVAVSRSLRLQAIPDDAALRVGLAAVDAVHTDGSLPVIPLVQSRLTKRHGQIVIRPLLGGAVEIAIDERTDRAEWTVVHEVGHFLDWHGIGRPGRFASCDDVLLAGWREAVKKSEAVQRLAQLLIMEAEGVTETLPDGTDVHCPISRRWIRYLLAPEELWARSYAQYIALKSDDGLLRRRLDLLRKRPGRSFNYGAQWEEDDFIGIATEIEAVFSRLGWRK